MLTLPARDKLLHYAVGSLAGLVGVGVSLAWPVQPWAIALLFAWAAGVCRELGNILSCGRWSNADIAWTILGGLTVAAAAALAAT